MKIALLTEKYTPDIGGLAISTERYAQLLASAGYNVRVFAPTSSLPSSEKRLSPSSGASVTRFGAHKRVDDTLVDWFELIVEEHKRDPFDVLHAYFLTQAGFVATYAGKYLNLPSVVSIRGNDIERAAFDPSKFSHVMFALHYAGAVTANSTALVKKAKAFSDREIQVIPNGIDTGQFKPTQRSETLAEAVGLSKNVMLSREAVKKLAHEKKGEDPSVALLPPSDIRVMGFAGELRQKKGLATLLSAYAQVNTKTPTSFLIVGEVRDGEDKKLFDEFRVSHPGYRIIVTGHVPHKDLPAYYSLMDVFVHPSLRDGMPNAVLEAMACEKAVIATPVGGVLDVIEDRVNGSLVPLNDAGSLSKAIVELLHDESLRKRLGEAARRKIINDFTLEKELKNNLDVYRRLGLKP